MTVSQIDSFQKLARRVEVARLAVAGLGADPQHEAVEEALMDIYDELRTLTVEVA